MPMKRTASGVLPAAPAAASQDEARTERARVLDIQAIGRNLSLDSNLIERAINEGWTRDQLAEQYSASRGPAIVTRTPVNRLEPDESRRTCEKPILLVRGNPRHG